MAKKAKKTKKKGKKKGSWKSQMFSILAVVMGAIFLPTTALLSIGMLPTAVAFIVDQGRRTKAVTVGAMNLAGCSPFMLELWMQGHSFDKALDIISDPKAIIVMYAAAAVGYFVDWAMSDIVAKFLYQRGKARQKAIKKRQEELVERWGKEVTGEIPLDEYGFPIKEKSMEPKDKKEDKEFA